MTTYTNGSATAIESADSRFSEQEAERFVMEVVDRAGSEGISPEESWSRPLTASTTWPRWQGSSWRGTDTYGD